MSRIFWDTNLFIYLFEGHEEFEPPTRALRNRMIDRGDEMLTSIMTLGEVQVGPRQFGEIVLAERYRDAIRQNCRVITFDEAAADVYAMLRATTSLRPPDAIQLSCAASAGVEVFVTNDKRLQKLSVPGIHFITSLDRVPV